MEIIFLLSAAVLILLGIVAVLRSKPRGGQSQKRPGGKSAREVAESHFAEITGREYGQDGSQLIQGRPHYHWPHQIRIEPTGISAEAVSKTHDGIQWGKVKMGKGQSPAEEQEMQAFANHLEQQLPEGSPVKPKDALSEEAAARGDEKNGQNLIG